jgi:hypothetical protein
MPAAFVMGTIAPLLLLLLSLCGCSGGYILELGVPAAPVAARDAASALELVFTDARTERSLFSPAAQAVFPYFTDRYRLALSTAERSERASEPFHDLESLLLTLFRQRCRSAGVTVLEGEQGGGARLTVLLRTWRLDLRGWQWRGQFQCDLVLEGPGGRRSVQRLAASGERFRLFGRRGAEILLGQLLGAGLDKADIAALLRAR